MPTTPERPQHVLLTGATGMVGAHLLAKLLRAGRAVAALVRPGESETSTERVMRVLARFDLTGRDVADRLRILSGSLTDGHLGLSPHDQGWAARHISEVLHCAASLSFRPASESVDGEPYRTNVDGTGRLIDQAKAWGIGSFHYVSTAYVCGQIRGEVREDDLDRGQSFANDYEHSKLLAEQRLIRESDWQVTVYRPSIVIDSTHRSPQANDRTVYGAFQTYQALAGKFGSPGKGGWFKNLGFTGVEKKNLVEADWVAESIVSIFRSPPHHGRTYHLTAPQGTAIFEIEDAFHRVCVSKGVGTRILSGAEAAKAAEASAVFQTMAAPYVKTFLPYFNDDPVFDQTNTVKALPELNVEVSKDVTGAEIQAMLIGSTRDESHTSAPDQVNRQPADAAVERGEDDDDLVVVGFDVCLPGGAEGFAAFEQVLFAGQSAIDEVPADRFDRSLYFDPKRGETGKAYTTLGGCVPESAIDPAVRSVAQSWGDFDPCHQQFASVAASAWRRAGIPKTSGLERVCGLYVGHSGGTKLGGPLAMSTMAAAAAEEIAKVPGCPAGDGDEIDGAESGAALRALHDDLIRRVRATRPRRRTDDGTHFNAYSAAALAARVLGLQGIREVIDAACASSLVALKHAATAISAGRIDAAIVGGATYNNVDNLILFSQSQACSDQHSCPFDEAASGLISSEGYVAVVITRRAIARKLGLSVSGRIDNIGIASDGRGKSLWAPRTEGQQLAIRRAYPDSPPLAIDYMECHATSTQVGDATELNSLTTLRDEHAAATGTTERLLIGSAKSNFGHTLEAAGLVGLVKVLAAMKRHQVPASIHFCNPATSFDWSRDRLAVADRNSDWPCHAGRDVKKAAVSAFGIGGLNAHAVVRSEPKDETGRSALSSAVVAEMTRRCTGGEAIAIVGRGVVLPGAFNVDELAKLTGGGQTGIGPPPADRWRGRSAVSVPGTSASGTGAPKQPFSTPHCHGGYIRGYEFNGQPYRIPPKQVALANPVQMMLIDAVRQALDELGEPKDFNVPPGQGVLDRSRTSVVIGTIFGGEFSNRLQVGMRIPELCRHLRESLKGQGFSTPQIEPWVEAYRRHMLNRYSAILDETGSFTASTLASRIAKTFDLMGGACAVDADDASGLLAILTAVDQLRHGDVDTVICGVAQRSLDLVAFEQLNLRHRLVASGNPSDVPRDCNQVLPGEGVAVMILKRQRDLPTLERSGATPKVHGTWNDITTDFVAEAARGRAIALDPDIGNASLVRQIGYLSGAHAVVRAITQTCTWQTDDLPARADRPHGHADDLEIAAVAEDGFSIRAVLRRPDPNPRLGSFVEEPRSTSRRSSATGKRFPAAAISAKIPDVVPTVSMKSLCRRAIDPDSVADCLHSWRENPTAALATDSDQTAGTGDITFAVVAEGPEALAEQADRMLKAWGLGTRVGVVDRAGGFFWRHQDGQNRVGWLFPGQGSQYPRRPQIFDADPDAAQAMRSFDRAMVDLGLPAIGERLDDPDAQLGKDVWWTQVWILAVSHVLADSLDRAGVPCDVASGHSFGECGAALHSGAMNVRQALMFAQQRSDAVLTTVRRNGQLLSIRASASRVAAVLKSESCDVVITHHNAPEQTVVAGTPDQVAVAKKAFAAAGLPAVVIAVPAAFHTSMMDDAEAVLRRTFSGERLRPASCPLLSAGSLRYLAEPDEVRENLIAQLTKPVLFASAAKRLAADGCGLLIEVGPGDVLTRLSRSSVLDSALCLSLDGGRGHRQQAELIRLAVEVVTNRSYITKPGLPTVSGKTYDGPAIVADSVSGAPSRNGSVSTHEVRVLDVTGERKTGPAKAKRDSRPEPPVRSPAINGTKASSKSAVRQSSAAAPVWHPTTSDDSAGKSNRDDATATDAAEVGGDVRSFLVDLVVELTGYSPDVVDFSADLEAELGIDSIKKAQVIGELAEWGNIQLDLTTMKLSDYVSLSDIAALHPAGQESSVALVADQSVVTAAPVQSCATPLPLPVQVGTVSPRDPGNVSPIGEPVSVGDSMASLMIDFVVDQTGYSVDIIDMDADLEAELGLDSIKKAQLLGELQEQFDLSSLDLGQVKLSDFATLRNIQSFVLQQWGEKKNGPVDDSFAVDDSPADESTAPLRAPAEGTCRFALKVVAADRLPGMPTEPIFHGSALILGDNAVAGEIIRRLSGAGIDTHQVRGRRTVEDVDRLLDGIWSRQETPHLFITTPRDDDALADLDSRLWNERRDEALTVPFRVCQRWMQRMIDTDQMSRASLVSVVHAGGDFGFSAADMPSPESGGIAGLTKAMRIESWMREFRETPMLIVDGAKDATPQSVVEGVWRELAVPSYDEEVVVDAVRRWTIDADYRPLSADTHGENRITSGGTWIVSGGGRGITAMTVMELASRYGLSLHLLGTAPEPTLDAPTRQAAATDRSELRRRVMRRAQAESANPIETWRDLEKAIEIDQTLQECRRRGLNATYHCVDVSDGEAVAHVVHQIRKLGGPIRGVIHGAGAGQDARFDRKRPDKVAKCIGAKVDGCIHLAAATMSDPLEWFVGFGSISGRFGANGHTDYSLSNDMLAKCVDRLKQSRPDVRCVTFHWHAWGDIGMAAKPEAKLALEMIGMQFMPAEEGLRHFLNEFRFGGDLSEVLITDRRYVRKFFPGPAVRQHQGDAATGYPLLDAGDRGIAAAASHAVTLDPVHDRFLSQHRIGGKPTLPMAVALEMMAEAASLRAGGKRVRVCYDVRAITALKFSSEDALACEVVADDRSVDDGRVGESDRQRWQLCADLRRADGRLVQEQRPHFRAEFAFVGGIEGRPGEDLSGRDVWAPARSLVFTPIEYLSPDAPIYHGESLQCLRSVHTDVAAETIFGRIAAPSPAHLGGENRPLSGWQTSCASMDACFYAAAVLAFAVHARPSLPVGFDRIELGRLPTPGEPLLVRWDIEQADQAGIGLRGELTGFNDDTLARFVGYRIGWLR